jgi:hypothetical protein
MRIAIVAPGAVGGYFEMMGRELPGRTVVGGSAYVSAVITAPGKLRYTSDMSAITFGAPADEALRPNATAFIDSCRKAGFKADMVDDVTNSLWNCTDDRPAPSPILAGHGVLKHGEEAVGVRPRDELGVVRHPGGWIKRAGETPNRRWNRHCSCRPGPARRS